MGAAVTVQLLHGDCRDVLKTLPDASVDSIVTDPPYELTTGKKGGTGMASVNLDSPYGRARIGTGNGTGGFMGQQWDATGIAHNVEMWAECLRVLKPGGHLLAFGGTRTYHRLACAIEDAGFELRNSVLNLHGGGDCPWLAAWGFGSGFPKSLDVSKALQASDQWRGWGTALKPAFEPIVMARKPLVGTVASNVLAHGTGALNIDGCRVAHDEECRMMAPSRANIDSPSDKCRQAGRRTAVLELKPDGRWPANLILSYPEDEYALRADVTPAQLRQIAEWLDANA